MKDITSYITIHDFMSRLYRNPILEGLQLESVIQYVADFFGIIGLNPIYETKEIELNIENYRCFLPIDLVDINQIKDTRTKQCLRPSTGTFDYNSIDKQEDITYKIQGNILVTSRKDAKYILNYKALPLDKDGYPLIPNFSIMLVTLELYIKTQYYQNLVELGQMSYNILGMVINEYDWRVGQLNSKLTIPSPAEMENITNMWNTLIPRTKEFRNGFKNLGNPEIIKRY